MYFAYKLTNQSTLGSNKLTKSYAVNISIKKPESKLRIIYLKFEDKEKLLSIVKKISSHSPPTIVFVANYQDTLQALSDSFRATMSLSVETLQLPMTLKAGTIYVSDISKSMNELHLQSSLKKTSIIILSEITNADFNKFTIWQSAQIILEETIKHSLNGADVELITDIVPATSIMYSSDIFLSKDE